MNNEPLFSILIPSWNNLPFLRLCIESIRKNSSFKHQIIVHVNEGKDDTITYLKENDIEYTYSEQNIGVCWALNALRPLVKTDYILYMNDDMYACPQWDKVLWDEIQRLPDNKFFLSATLIQPRPFFCKSVIAPADYGNSPANFDEEKLLSTYKSLPHNDWCGATWPPNIVHRDVWDLVGGYSIEYSPGMYSDPDFTAKLYLAGVRHFKGLSDSRVYHFEATSTGRVKRNNGSLQFLRKWGITSSSFMRDIVHRGEPWKENLIGRHSRKLVTDRKRSILKMIFCTLKNTGVTKNLWD